jgi:hypothetical protein
MAATTVGSIQYVRRPEMGGIIASVRLGSIEGSEGRKEQDNRRSDGGDGDSFLFAP